MRPDNATTQCPNCDVILAPAIRVGTGPPHLAGGLDHCPRCDTPTTMVEGFDTVTSQGPAEAAVHVYRLAHDTDADQRRRIRKNLQAAMAAADAAVAGDVAFIAALTDESRAWLDALRAIVPGHKSRMELMTLVMVILMVLTFLEQNEPPATRPAGRAARAARRSTGAYRGARAGIP